jgi:hypothetical protein
MARRLRCVDVRSESIASVSGDRRHVRFRPQSRHNDHQEGRHQPICADEGWTRWRRVTEIMEFAGLLSAAMNGHWRLFDDFIGARE